MMGAAPTVGVPRYIGCRGRGEGGRLAAALRLVRVDARSLAAAIRRVDGRVDGLALQGWLRGVARSLAAAADGDWRGFFKGRALDANGAQTECQR
jgi:hypothetical protein